ncbi:hypothetical protein GBA52_017921 [Prunus armeniaca]|nr:hypothetical protein GBA52_017921 [Prunus armeniaca]
MKRTSMGQLLELASVFPNIDSMGTTFPARANTPFSVYNTANSFYQRNYSSSFAVIPARSAVRHHAQLAWKRLSDRFSFNGGGFSGITNIAQAFSLAVTGSNLILAGIFAIS